MDSDSDSDHDSLLKDFPTFLRPSRRATKLEETAHAKADRILEQANHDFDKSFQLQQLIAKMKQEELDIEEEELMEKARNQETLTRDRKKQRREDEEQQRRRQQQQQQHQAANEADLDQPRTYLYAADTEQSSKLGVRRTLWWGNEGNVVCRHDELPDRYNQAVELLQFILNQELQHDGNTQGTTTARTKGSVMEALQTSIQNNTLTDFLSNATLCRLCSKQNRSTLPHSLIRWLFLVACSGSRGDEKLGVLSCGAFTTLCKLWTDNKGKPDNGYILSVSSLEQQLKAWFGLRDQAVDCEQKVQQVHSEATVDVAGFKIFLFLWNIALNKFLVYSQSGQAISHAIMILFMTGVDKIFYSDEKYVLLFALRMGVYRPWYERFLKISQFYVAIPTFSRYFRHS